MIKLTTNLNSSGQRLLTVKCGSSRAFSLQTNNNIRAAHNCDNNILANCAINRAKVLKQVRDYVEQFGTKSQREVIKLYLSDI